MLGLEGLGPFPDGGERASAVELRIYFSLVDLILPIMEPH
jgi:hypothetical protein